MTGLEKMLIKNMLYGYYDTQCLYAVSKLKVAEYLKTGKKSITKLAELTNSDENRLYRIMRFLAARRLFNELPDRVFSLNNESNFLLSSTPGNLKNFIDLHGIYFYQGATGILENLKEKLTPFEISVGQSFQLPTIFTAKLNPNSISVSLDRPLHIIILPGGGSEARAR